MRLTCIKAPGSGVRIVTGQDTCLMDRIRRITEMPLPSANGGRCLALLARSKGERGF